MEWIFIGLIMSSEPYPKSPSSIILQMKTRDACDKVGKRFVSLVAQENNNRAKYECINIKD